MSKFGSLGQVFRWMGPGCRGRFVTLALSVLFMTIFTPLMSATAEENNAPDLAKTNISAHKVVVGRQDVVADGNSAYTAKVIVVNRDGSLLPNVTVQFLPDPQLNLTASSCKTSANGNCSVRATSTVAGTHSLGATISGGNIGNVAKLKFVAGAAVAIEASVNPQEILVNGSSTVIVRLKDASGNILERGGDQVAVVSTLGSPTAVTDSRDGTYTTIVTSKTSGTAELRFTLNGEQVPPTKTVNILSGSAGSAGSAGPAGPAGPAGLLTKPNRAGCEEWTALDGVQCYALSEQALYLRTQGAWVRVWKKEGTPYAMAAGFATNPLGGSARVNFPPGRFTVCPIITMANTGTSVSNLNAQCETKDYANMAGYDAKTNPIPSSFFWIAVQMTPITAAG